MLRSFFDNLIQSSTDPSYYRGLLKDKLSDSIKFFLFTLFLLSIIDLAVIRFRYAPQVLGDVRQEFSHLVEQIPSKATFTYSPSRLSTQNLTLPLILKSQALADKYGLSENLFAVSSEEKPQAFITFAPSAVHIQGNSEMSLEPRSLAYERLWKTQWKLDKPQIEEKLASFHSNLETFATLLCFLAIPVWFVVLLFNTMLILLLLSLFSHSIAWLIGIRLSLTQVLHLGLHAIAVATLIDVIKFMLYAGQSISLVIPAYLGIMLLVFWHLKSQRH